MQRSHNYIGQQLSILHYYIMNNKSKVTIALSAAVLALSTGGIINAETKRLPSERCADIVKKGKNACDANGHSCAGQSTVDNQPNEWIKVPVGTCSTIVTICNSDQPKIEGLSDKKLGRICKKIAKQSDASITGGRVVTKAG